MSPAGDDSSTTADPGDPVEVERAEHPDSFDPGPETGYLRRGHRDHDLDVDSGAAPFDPGPDHYDDRRARRESKKREKAERVRREREQKERAAKERAETQAREKQETAGRERAERERRAAEQAERAEREREVGEAELRSQRERAREAEAEKAERAHSERERLRREERERAASERAERKRAKQAERESRDAELQAERERIASERAERDRSEREQARRRGRGAKASTPESASSTDLERSPSGGTAVATRPKPKEKLKPSERLRLADLNLQPAGRPSPEPRAPRLTDKPAHVSLRRPTAKVGAALLVVAAVAALAGSAVGLPVPGLGDDSPAETSDTGVDAAALALLDAGTPVGLSKGPYHPVVGDEIGYGEQLAKFGAARSGRRHEGQDVFAKPGTPLVSVRDGIVVDEAKENDQYSGGRGNYVVVYSQLDGRSYVYLHMLEPSLVENGEIVEAGQPLGQVGCTGSCDGPHLHFEVRNGRQTLTAETKAVDPLPLLKDWPSVPVPAQG